MSPYFHNLHFFSTFSYVHIPHLIHWSPTWSGAWALLNKYFFSTCNVENDLKRSTALQTTYLEATIASFHNIVFHPQTTTHTDTLRYISTLWPSNIRYALPITSDFPRGISPASHYSLLFAFPSLGDGPLYSAWRTTSWFRTTIFKKVESNIKPRQRWWFRLLRYLCLDGVQTSTKASTFLFHWKITVPHERINVKVYIFFLNTEDLFEWRRKNPKKPTRVINKLKSNMIGYRINSPFHLVIRERRRDKGSGWRREIGRDWLMMRRRGWERDSDIKRGGITRETDIFRYFKIFLSVG